MWGNDYVAYLEMYQDFNRAGFDLFDIEKNAQLRGGKEYGWVILNRIFGTLHLGFFGMIIALTILENWIIRRMILKFVEPRYYWVAIAFFVFTTWFPTDASMMRQYLCVCLYMLVVELMVEKKVRGYLLWAIGIIALGTTLHLSTAAMFASLPLYYIHFKRKSISIFAISCIAVILFFWNTHAASLIDLGILRFMVIDEGVRAYAGYMYESSSDLGTGFGVIFYYVKLVVFFWLFLQIKEKEKQTIVLLMIVSYFFGAIGAIIPVAGRLSLFFTIMQMVIWPWLFSLSKKHIWLYLIIIAQIIIMGKEITDFFYDPVWHDRFFEYHTIFDAPNWM